MAILNKIKQYIKVVGFKHLEDTKTLFNYSIYKQEDDRLFEKEIMSKAEYLENKIEEYSKLVSKYGEAQDEENWKNYTELRHLYIGFYMKYIKRNAVPYDVRFEDIAKELNLSYSLRDISTCNVASIEDEKLISLEAIYNKLKTLMEDYFKDC